MTITKIEQAGRPIQAKHPLGDPDELVPLRLVGGEGLSRPFRFVVDFLSPTARLAPAKLLGKGIGLMVHGAPNTTRLLHGRVAHWAELGIAGTSGLTHYRAELVPWFWLLTLSSDCRTFENKTVREVVEAVFNAHGFRDFKFSVAGALPKLPYVVQYQESDFDFVSRLLEEAGLYYTYEFHLEKHVMVITDRLGSLIPAGVIADVQVAPFVRKEAEDVGKVGENAAEAIAEHVLEDLVKPVGIGLVGFGVGGMVAGALGRLAEHLIIDLFTGLEKPPPNTVTDLHRERRVHTKMMAARDFHLLRAADTHSETSGDPGVFGERFAFLGDLAGTSQAGVSRADAKRRIEVEETTRDVFRGTSTACTFTAGTRVKINGGVLTLAGSEVHVTDVAHVVSAGDLLTGDKADIVYTNKFIAIPVGTTYRPERKTPRPSVRGTQTAEIVGEGGAGQIDVDANGCVLLKFPWDRGDGKDGKSKYRVHVASLWSGTGWGEIHLPRVGQLVLVEFLEGDPDRPIVTGRVYSREHPHPYTLPANKTQSGIKSRTVGGGDVDFNELRFEDKKGSEHVFLQAQKDLQTKVKNNETRTVHNNRTTVVANNDTRTVGGTDKDGNEVGGNDSITVKKGNRSVTVTKGNLTTTVGANVDTSVGQNETHTVGKNQTIDVGEARAETVGKDESVRIGGARTVDVGKDDALSVGKTLTIEAADEIVLKSGMAKITLKKDGTILIEGKEVNVKAMAKIQMKAPMVKVAADGQVEVKGAIVKVEGQGMLQMKAPMSQLNGDGMLMAKGGLTMIN